ncbi:MAG TPA: DUF5694 domain-containing protein [Candidatus Tumulicola sp.]|jgi:hypothetical protein
MLPQLLARGGALLLTFAVCIAPRPSVSAENPPTARVMIVGVAHFVAKNDVHNSTFTDSPLSAGRQAQIREVVDRLARFKPNKVLVEETYGDPVWNQRYLEYRAGTFTLPANEVYQFGFRLAEACANTTIYPIDTFGPTLIDDSSADGKRIDAYLEANFKNVPSVPFDALLARQADLEQHGTYLELLRFLNTDEAITANASWYAVMAGNGRSAADAGAAYTAQWYTRNTYIYSNILSVVEPGDRVAVIMGQGHKFLLRQFVQLNPHLTYVDVEDYLR